MSTDLTRRLLENVPAPMQSATRWCNWRYEVRNGKRTKVPVCSYTGRPASSTDPATWGTLARALACVELWDGVGYVFAAGDGLVGIDLDHCRVAATAEMTPFSLDVLDRLWSYSETSVSGDGIHIVCRGVWQGPRHRAAGIEVYSEGRFFCMTGDAIVPWGLEERTPELAELYAELFPPPPPDTGPSQPPSAPPPLDDSGIFRVAMGATNGAKFSRLWHGDTSDYPSKSEADAGLLGILSFYTTSPAQLESLLNASGLARDKWHDRPDYRERTIALVLRRNGAHFSPSYAA